MRDRVFRLLLLYCSILAASAARKPRALLINLPQHDERFNGVKLQLDKANIPFERAEAVNGKAMTPEELKANVTWLARLLLTKGMIGCFLSHRSCWQRCVDEASGPILGASASFAVFSRIARMPSARSKMPLFEI